MVYRGKPSKSCRECRKRDIKCDKKAGGCSQCERASLSCSGYPDPTQLIIYDETKSTINRGQRDQVSRKSAPLLSDPTSIILLPSWEIRAKSLFVSQYVADSDKLNLFSYMRVFYPPDKRQFPLLETVIRAVWLAFFSFSHQSPMALHDARVSYGSALMLTTSAIQSPQETHQLGRTQYAPSNAHLRGALGLALHRGDSQFSDPIRMNMLWGLLELIILECLAHDLDIPSDLLVLSSKVSDNAAASTPKWQFLRVLLEYAQLKELLRHGISSDVAICWAERLGCKLDDLSNNLDPVVSSKQTRGRSRTSGVESLIKYPDRNVRRSWNNIRVIRMLLADIIREQCAISLSTPETTRTALVIEKLHNSTRTITSLCSEIYHSASDSSITAINSEKASSVQISTLFFHLYAANSAKVIPDKLRQLIQKRLQSLSEGQFSGIQRLMAQLLQDDDVCHQNIWKAWLRLGKESFSI